MAGASSEAGNLNIGITETSSHPEIEPEIKAEATRDFDEVCGLEKKECNDIMEHLKNNPELVVKSLGPEGQIVVHVAVMVGETKKPKPQASKCIDKGFNKAANDSDWYLALDRLDCKALMALLQANPCLVAQTGPEGWMVLHAAAQRGCLELLDQVFNLFKFEEMDGFEGNGQFVDEPSGVNVRFEDLCIAKCGEFEAVATDMAQFTCSAQILKRLIDGREKGWKYRESFSSMQRSSSDASQHFQRDKLVEIIQGEPSKNAFERLERNYCRDENYNFVLEPLRKELQFHYACGEMLMESAFGEFIGKNYVKTIIDGCRDLGPFEFVKVLTYLFQLHNAQGQTPFHVASTSGNILLLLELVPQGDAYKECLNAKDVRGWTILHNLAATGQRFYLEKLLEDERIDLNTRTSDMHSYGRKTFYRIDPNSWTSDIHSYGMTALHLAILHDHAKCVELLLKCPRTDVNALLRKDIQCGYEKIRNGDRILTKNSYWSPLQLAAIMGLTDVVRTLLVLKICDIYDDGKLQKNSAARPKDFRGISALLLASASGNPDTLRLFLDNEMFNPLFKFEGATALHYATNAMIPRTKLYYSSENFKVGRFLQLMDLEYLNHDTCRYDNELEDMKSTPTLYLGKQACITMLLQAGVDIWEKDNQKRFAEPGLQASEEASLWWHEKIARETFEAKKSLNDAANAISVVAALVATASFVGPLQPPLGYGRDSVEGGIQDTHLSVRVFLVSNILSFYLAIASIMFAVVPSLPMPQEGIYAEWQRTRRTIGVAIFFLLMSVLGVLISFGAASNSVVSEDYSWRHVGLSFYPTLLGGFICILGISLFFLRLLRLVFNGNAKIRYLYKTFVKF